MNSRICEYVSGHTEPDFFDRPDDELSDIQIEIGDSTKKIWIPVQPFEHLNCIISEGTFNERHVSK